MLQGYTRLSVLNSCVFVFELFFLINKSLICLFHHVPCTNHLKGSLTLNWILFPTHSHETKFLMEKELSFTLSDCWQTIFNYVKIALTHYIIMRYPHVVLLPLHAKLGQTLSFSVQRLDIKGLQLDIGQAPVWRYWPDFVGWQSCGQCYCHMTLKSKLASVGWFLLQQLDRDRVITVLHLIFL